MQVYLLSMLGIPLQYVELAIYALNMTAVEEHKIVIHSVFNPY